MARTAACLAGMVWLASSCGSSHDVSAGDYTRACSSDSDCVAVFDGHLTCCGTGCPNAAIAKTSENKYWSDVLARTPTCNPAPPCLVISDGVCEDKSTVTCVASVCTFAPP